ncbi:hypothetical protein FCM35_KLT10894 [Carex littledalei]|uniref:Uncharacterized protein n=1 Tax=Carex littledalei TaxID=544730 RepID=A0A833QS69_9POAL|nr:hypothetical protein FCM35_KLT10894 [Carex littledalei]
MYQRFGIRVYQGRGLRLLQPCFSTYLEVRARAIHRELQAQPQIGLRGSSNQYPETRKREINPNRFCERESIAVEEKESSKEKTERER